MNTQLLKHLGNIDQIAGIRESQLLRGRGEQIQIAEFYNAAGLRFTVVPDRCMDIFDLSYKGVNISYQSKNGLTSPQAFCPTEGEFAEQWPAGMMVTCGLDNVGGHSHNGGEFPTHGRTSHVPAKYFGARTFWEGDDYILRARGEIHQTKMFSRHLALNRTIETSLNAKSIRIHDVITNYEAEDEPYMLLYHCNFGYPILQAGSCVRVSKADVQPLNDPDADPVHMHAPVDGCGEDCFLHHVQGDTACGVIYNENLELGAYVAFDTKNLPRLLQWKCMKSHDYVLGLEPCNTAGLNREKAAAQNKLAMIPAYGSVENHLEIGVLDGLTEIREFVKNL